MISFRKEFPKKVKLAAWQRSGGICECGCGVKIIVGDGPEYDHVEEDYLGGEPTLENCMVMRKRCHDAKTAKNRPVIDKTRRGFEKRINARETSSPMPCGRKSKFKKKLSGEVIRRDR